MSTSTGDRARQFQSPLPLDVCQERLLARLEQSDQRVHGRVGWQDFRVWVASRFGLGAVPVVDGRFQPEPDGTRIAVRVGLEEPAGSARLAAIAVWAVLWLLWLGAVVLWLFGPADTGVGPVRVLTLLVVNLGMGATYLLGRRLDRSDPEDLLALLRDEFEASEIPRER